MTAEEVLNDSQQKTAINNNIGKGLVTGHMKKYFNEASINAMNDYAEQMSVGFAEYCEKNYEIVVGNEWRRKYYEEGKMDITYTTTELYKEYIYHPHRG